MKRRYPFLGGGKSGQESAVPAVSAGTTSHSDCANSSNSNISTSSSLHRRRNRQTPPPPALTPSSSSPSNPFDGSVDPPLPPEESHNDAFNYALLIVLYTLQGIPMGLSASIPFLIQQKVRHLVTAAAATSATAATTATSAVSEQLLKAAGSSANAAAAAAAVDPQQLAAMSHAAAQQLSYKANAVFALCSWPFSLKLLWAPIVDALYSKRWGRRKSWLVPVQLLAGLVMVAGADFLQASLGILTPTTTTTTTGTSSTPPLAGMATSWTTETLRAVVESQFSVQGLTLFFFVLYLLMATQDIAVDGWALTMLSKENRGRGPVCNSIGQNIGFFISFVGFLALNDAESCNRLWRPLLRLPANDLEGMVSLKTFMRCMGYFMLATTAGVALFKREGRSEESSRNKSHRSGMNQDSTSIPLKSNMAGVERGDGMEEPALPLSSQKLLNADRLPQPDVFSNSQDAENLTRAQYHQSSMSVEQDGNDDDDDKELDAAELGLAETYKRLWQVCKLPSVRWLFLILLTYRLPTALSDNVKFLKAVDLGLSKSTTALLSPTVILPLGILVPIVATKIWHGHPLKQFMRAYEFRVTLIPLLDYFMLSALSRSSSGSGSSSMAVYWVSILLSTAAQTIANSLQFNAQMTFFASRVDPRIGGSYMTLLNTAANLGGTWPASVVLWILSRWNRNDGSQDSSGGSSSGDNGSYFALQVVLSCLGGLWIAFFGKKVFELAALPAQAWQTERIVDNPTGGAAARRAVGNRDIESTEVTTLEEDELRRQNLSKRE